MCSGLERAIVLPNFWTFLREKHFVLFLCLKKKVISFLEKSMMYYFRYNFNLKIVVI